MDNIYSGSDDPLCAALTNPTELARRKGKLDRSYPVTDKTGKVWPDAEAAYQAFKSRPSDFNYDYEVMLRILKAKLRQYPELVEQITERGGHAWLEKTQHSISPSYDARSRWTGQGIYSYFILALKQAYGHIMAETSKEP